MVRRLLVAFLAVSVLCAGCGGKKDAKKDGGKAKKPDQKEAAGNDEKQKAE